MRGSLALRVSRIAVVAALYIGVSLAGAPLAYGGIQFRFSELLMLLCFYRKDYGWSMIVGCAVTNLFSPLGPYDVLFGTLATALAVVCICKLSPRLFVATLYPTLFCVIVGAELYFLTGVPFLLTTATVMAGEFAVVTVLGWPLFKLLEKNRAFMRLIGAKNATNAAIKQEETT